MHLRRTIRAYGFCKYSAFVLLCNFPSLLLALKTNVGCTLSFCFEMNNFFSSLLQLGFKFSKRDACYCGIFASLDKSDLSKKHDMPMMVSFVVCFQWKASLEQRKSHVAQNFTVRVHVKLPHRIVVSVKTLNLCCRKGLVGDPSCFLSVSLNFSIMFIFDPLSKPFYVHKFLEAKILEIM